MKGRRWLGPSLLLVAAASSWWVWTLRPREPARPPAPPRSDYVLRDFELVMLGNDGSESLTVTGPTLERTPDGRELVVSEPRFGFPDPKRGRWLAKSRLARVSADGEQVDLTGAVEFLGPSNGAGDAIRFASERLQVYPKQQRAEAPGAVTVHQGGSILRGEQLHADLAAQRYQLNAIQGRYAPPAD